MGDKGHFTDFIETWSFHEMKFDENEILEFSGER